VSERLHEYRDSPSTMTAWCAEIGDVALRGHLEALEQTLFGSRKPAEPWDGRRFASALSIARQAWLVDGGRTIADAPAPPALDP
jgi:hypothetical protein